MMVDIEKKKKTSTESDGYRNRHLQRKRARHVVVVTFYHFSLVPILMILSTLYKINRFDSFYSIRF